MVNTKSFKEYGALLKEIKEKIVSARVRAVRVLNKELIALYWDIGEIPWGHNILIFSRVKETKVREYYLKSTASFAWSRNVLLNQINAKAYQHHLKNPKRHNFEKVLSAHLLEQADESVKDVYNLDFLGITTPVLEREIERRLIKNVVVEYALRDVSNPMGVARYHLTTKLPKELKAVMPGERELKEQIKEGMKENG